MAKGKKDKRTNNDLQNITHKVTCAHIQNYSFDCPDYACNTRR